MQFDKKELEMIQTLVTYRLKWAEGDEFDALITLIRKVKAQLVKTV